MASMRATQRDHQSGQAAIESAVILPLFVFLLLGILQLGLMHQARLMTKYAAYKAVRAGALHNARTEVMARSALAVLLPMVSEGNHGAEFIQPVNSADDFREKWLSPGILNNVMKDTPLPYVEATICGPSRKELRGLGRELDFDDPQVSASGSSGSGSGMRLEQDWHSSHRTKLRIQVTFNYRMPIPFANWVIHSVARNREIPFLMRMGEPGPMPSRIGQQYDLAARTGVYILPIRAAYTMRMQSNVYLSQLPESNECRTTNRY